MSSTPEPAPVEAEAPVEAVPVEAVPVEAVPVEAAPVEAAPVEAAPVEATPVEVPAEVPAEAALPAPAAPAPAEECPAPAEELAAPADAPAHAAEDAPTPPAEAEAPPPNAAAVPEEVAAPAPAVEAPAEGTVEVPAVLPAKAPIEVPAELPAPAEAPVEVAPELPAEAPIEAPAEVPVEVPAAAEAPAEVPAEVPTEVPADLSPGAPTEVSAEVSVEAPATPTQEEAAPAADTPADAAVTLAAVTLAAAAAPAAAEDAATAAAAIVDAPAEAAPAEAALPEEPPKAPTPPPPTVPPGAPLSLTVEEVSDTAVTLRWRPPETLGGGLDGYALEYCRDGAADWVMANAELTAANRLAITDLTTGDLLHIRVVAINAGGRSPPATLPQPVTVREVGDRPKVRLPRFLRARCVKQVGEQVNLLIPFCGKPKPVVTWTKDGAPLDTDRVNIRTSEKDSILFIRSGVREDSGRYQISVKVDSLEDTATLLVQIVDLPGPPSSMRLVDCWGFNAALEWSAPQDTGNTEITGYTVQKSDKRTGEWFTVLDHCHRLSATVSDLVMGNSYSFRVFAENKVGVSKSAATAKEVATITKTDIDYTPVEFKEHNFGEAPKFTTALNDRAATVGYNTKLLCAVRGSPKPKIEWLKNMLVISDDPKYRQSSQQGVCLLEIRKPCSFDGGVYTCRAKNPHGEATVACKLELKQVIIPDAEKGK